MAASGHWTKGRLFWSMGGPVWPERSHSHEALPMDECQHFMRWDFTAHPHILAVGSHVHLTAPSSHPAHLPPAHDRFSTPSAQLLLSLFGWFLQGNSSLEKDSHSVSPLNSLQLFSRKSFSGFNKKDVGPLVRFKYPHPVTGATKWKRWRASLLLDTTVAIPVWRVTQGVVNSWDFLPAEEESGAAWRHPYICKIPFENSPAL